MQVWEGVILAMHQIRSQKLKSFFSLLGVILGVLFLIVVVTVVEIRGDKVRLGIDAPQDIPVHRQEVYEAIQRENRKASQVQPKETRDLGK